MRALKYRKEKKYLSFTFSAEKLVRYLKETYMVSLATLIKPMATSSIFIFVSINSLTSFVKLSNSLKNKNKIFLATFDIYVKKYMAIIHVFQCNLIKTTYPFKDMYFNFTNFCMNFFLPKLFLFHENF